MRPVAMNARRGQREVRTTRLRIGRAVGPCAQSRVPRAIATARDALSNDWCESAVRFERPAKQALALATEVASSEARGKVL